jgi:hypothetical protein
MHLLLWSLESFSKLQDPSPPLRAVRAQFSRFVHLGERIDLEVLDQKPERIP